MPSCGYRYIDRSAEHRAHEAREQQRKRDSWQALKAQVAAKYA